MAKKNGIAVAGTVIVDRINGRLTARKQVME